MGRSIKKGPYIDHNLEGKVEDMNGGKTKKGVIKTWSRRSTISPDFVGHTFAVHNGQNPPTLKTQPNPLKNNPNKYKRHIKTPTDTQTYNNYTNNH